MLGGAWRCTSIRAAMSRSWKTWAAVTKRWSIEAFVVGDDYATVRDRLIDACDMPGAGELVHPYLGSLQVACTACSLTERTSEGRMARFSLSFVEAGANQYPSNPREHRRQRDHRRRRSCRVHHLSQFLERFGI